VGEPVVEGPVCTCTPVDSLVQTLTINLLPVTVEPKVTAVSADYLCGAIGGDQDDAGAGDGDGDVSAGVCNIE